ncbi:CBS domain-containing protein [Nocardioides salsibiostraticola]
MRIGEVLSAKSSSGHDAIITIAPEAGVRDLLAALSDNNVGALIVSPDGTTLSGIVSERDVVRKLHSDGTVINNTVEAIMTAEVETCSSETSLDELMSVMTSRRIRHVPVVDDGVLTGIISIGDVVKHKMSQLEFERDQLDHYVNQS